MLALFLENEAQDRTLVNRTNRLSCHFSLGSITFMTRECVHVLEDFLIVHILAEFLGVLREGKTQQKQKKVINLEGRP